MIYSDSPGELSSGPETILYQTQFLGLRLEKVSLVYGRWFGLNYVIYFSLRLDLEWVRLYGSELGG